MASRNLLSCAASSANDHASFLSTVTFATARASMSAASPASCRRLLDVLGCLPYLRDGNDMRLRGGWKRACNDAGANGAWERMRKESSAPRLCPSESGCLTRAFFASGLLFEAWPDKVSSFVRARAQSPAAPAAVFEGTVEPLSCGRRRGSRAVQSTSDLGGHDFVLMSVDQNHPYPGKTCRAPGVGTLLGYL
eukprot:3795346-Rhodomonas_salina.1